MKDLLKIPVAHRGLHDETKPENSMAAFEEAVKSGYAIETDVHPSKDGALVLFHDDTLVRMTGLLGRVNDLNLAELQALRLGGTEEKIPLLEDLLRLVNGKVPILLEIKNEPSVDTDGFLKKIAAAFDGYPGEYAVQSFQPIYVKGYKTLRPDVSCGLLATAHPPITDFVKPFRHVKRYIVSHMSLNFFIQPDFISYLFSDYPNRATERFRGPKFAWTVRSPEDEARARKYADNIIFENYRAPRA